MYIFYWWINWIYINFLRRITKYCALVTLLATSQGLAIGWASPYLAQLTDEDPPFRVTDEEGSWIASLLPLGRVLGAVIGSLTLEYIGSKRSVLLTGLPMIFSWICIICATSPTWLYVSRIFSGNNIWSCYPSSTIHWRNIGSIYPQYMPIFGQCIANELCH